MKTKLIQTNLYYLLVDEKAEIKDGNWTYWKEFSTEINKIKSIDCDYVWFEDNQCLRSDCLNPKYKTLFKIIAHLPKGNAPKLEGVDLLPEKGCKFCPLNGDCIYPKCCELPNDEEDVLDEIDFVASQLEDTLHGTEGNLISKLRGLLIKAKQSEKKYSEEDMINAIKFFKSYQVLYKRDIFDKDINHYLQSLSSTTPIDFEVEMVDEIVDLGRHGSTTVSYTHLTLPTILRV